LAVSLGALWGQWVTRLVALFFLMVALVTARHNLLLAIEQRAGQSPERVQDAQVQPLIEWIQENTDPSDVFLSGHPYALYLYAHRLGAFVEYSSDQNELLQQILTSGARYVVPSIEGRIAGSNMTMGETIYIQSLLDTHSDIFLLAYESPDNPQIRVYEIRH